METRKKETPRGKIVTRPPHIIEVVVERLVPGPFRDCVMGDLSERYASPRQYLRDVARMLPVLVAGQVRRAFDPVLVAAEACALSIAFISSPGASFAPASIAVLAVALALLTLRDAYAYPREISKREALLDAVVAATVVLVFQVLAALAAPLLALETEILVRGVAISLVAVPMVRIVFGPARRLRAVSPNGAKLPPGAGDPTKGTWPMYVILIISGVTLFARESTPILVPISDLLLPLIVIFALARPSSSIRDRATEAFSLVSDRLPSLGKVDGCSWNGVAKALFFIALALPLGATLWAGLSGGPVSVDGLKVAIHFTALLTLSLLWFIRKREPLLG